MACTALASLAMEPSVMLWDEITSALDHELVGEVLRVVESLADEGMALLMVTHEMGTPEQIFSNPHTPELKQLLSAFH